MVCRINDFKYKDVVDAADGCRLDTADARLTAIVIRGRLRLFGLLGREDDLVIPWEDIQVIGQDTILVRTRPAALSGRRRHKP